MRLNLATPATLQIYEPESNKKRFSVDMMKVMRKEVRDFDELAWAFNEEMDAAAAAGNFNDAASQRSGRSRNSARSGRSCFSNNASVM